MSSISGSWPVLGEDALGEDTAPIRDMIAAGWRALATNDTQAQDQTWADLTTMAALQHTLTRWINKLNVLAEVSDVQAASVLLGYSTETTSEIFDGYNVSHAEEYVDTCLSGRTEPFEFRTNTSVGRACGLCGCFGFN